MHQIDYILIDSDCQAHSSQSGRPVLSHFRHYIIVHGNLRNEESKNKLVRQLVQLRHHHPEAKILGISEINDKELTRRNIHPCDSMNQLRRELSDYP